MSKNDRTAIVVAALLCGLGGWIADPWWAAAIGGAIGGLLMAVRAAAERPKDRENERP